MLVAGGFPPAVESLCGGAALVAAFLLGLVWPAGAFGPGCGRSSRPVGPAGAAGGVSWFELFVDFLTVCGGQSLLPVCGGADRSLAQRVLWFARQARRVLHLSGQHTLFPETHRRIRTLNALGVSKESVSGFLVRPAFRGGRTTVFNILRIAASLAREHSCVVSIKYPGLKGRFQEEHWAKFNLQSADVKIPCLRLGPKRKQQQCMLLGSGRRSKRRPVEWPTIGASRACGSAPGSSAPQFVDSPCGSGLSLKRRAPSACGDTGGGARPRLEAAPPPPF